MSEDSTERLGAGGVSSVAARAAPRVASCDMPLYQPIRDWSDLPPGPPSKSAESLALDFKSEHHRNIAEHAKDMAAFANAFGGVLLVGVAESADAFTRSLMPLRAAKAAARDYENAARDLLSPRPLVDPSILLFPEDESLALVAVNIDPYPGQLIGAKMPNTMAWRFPIRTAARHTTYVDPENFMIHADPRTRKAAVLLCSIASTERKSVWVQLMERRELPEFVGNTEELLQGELRSVDVMKNTACFSVRLEDGSRILPIDVPLEDIEAVWKWIGGWTVRLNGALRFRQSPEGSRVISYMSGRGPYSWR